MATSDETDHTMSGSDEELPVQEDETGKQPYKTERAHVDALIDISEEDFLKELEPYEYHCYPGWEEAVLGWARVAPLSCILLSQKRDRKAKHKEADNPTPLPVDPIICNVDSSAGNAERRCELQAGPHNSSKKYMPLSQLTVSCSHTIAEARQPEWSVFNAMKNNLSHLLLEEKIEAGGTPLQPYHQPNVPENRSSRPPKHTRRPNSKVLPIKNFIFLPPINSVQKAKGQLCSRMKAPEDALEENCCKFDKRSDTRGLRLDHVADQDFPIYTPTLTAKYQTCQHHRFSDVNVSLPKRHHVPMASKPDIVH